MSEVDIRDLIPKDVIVASKLHVAVLGEEFISRAGIEFMSRYYNAWIKSDFGVAVGAFNEGKLVGVLLGTTDPGSHYKSMVKTSGLNLIVGLVVSCIKKSDFRKELVRTRLVRYTRGVAKLLYGRLRRHENYPIENEKIERVGELTHVFVDSESQAKGIGTQLVKKMIDRCERENIDTLTLVTPPESSARILYTKLGFKEVGGKTSSSNETYLKMEYSLAKSAS